MAALIGGTNAVGKSGVPACSRVRETHEAGQLQVGRPRDGDDLAVGRPGDIAEAARLALPADLAIGTGAHHEAERPRRGTDDGRDAVAIADQPSCLVERPRRAAKHLALVVET